MKHPKKKTAPRKALPHT